MRRIVVVVLSLMCFRGALADIEVLNYINKQVPVATDAQDIYMGVMKYSHVHSVDPRLVVSIIKTESNFKKVALSPKGAMGLMQVMPFHFNKQLENGKNISDNLKVGTRVLARCLNQSGGDIPIALAMYNAGEGAVKKYGGIPPYKETQGYVQKVISIYNNTFSYNSPIQYSGNIHSNNQININTGQLKQNKPSRKFEIAWIESNFNLFPEENLDESK